MLTKTQKRISSGSDVAELDFALAAGMTPLMVSFYERSLLTMKAIGASFNAKRASMQLYGENRTNSLYVDDAAYDFYCTKVDGYDPFYHGIVIRKDLHEKYLITTEGREAEDFYSYLMRNHDLPLMREWAPALWNWAEKNICRRQIGELFLGKSHVVNTREIPLPDGRKVALADLKVYFLSDLSTEVLENCVTNLIHSGIIKVAERPQNKLEFDSMDDYFNRYGAKIVKNLSDQLDPLTDYTGEVDNFTLKHKRLYPQQIAMVRGVTSLLTGVGNKKERRKNHSRYGLLVEGMGTGKTIQGSAICEAVSVATALRGGKSLVDAYSTDKDSVKYRNIVMCPGHLVEKWAAEVREELPYAKAVILRDFEDLIALWQKGSERTGKEFYVMSKDFAKLSYSEKPVPTKVATRKIRYRKCNCCGREVRGAGACSCGSVESRIMTESDYATGMICPNCNSLLIPASGRRTDDEGEAIILQPSDFAKKTTANASCGCCGENLWQPHVRNLGEGLKDAKWVRISHFANKARKGKKSVWMHKDFLEKYLSDNGIKEDDYTVVHGEGVRRYDPASFIKKHMKNFFDIAIFDEVHTLKGDTAQGHAMHALVKASKRQLALTGTIAGGYAHHLFYMLFRLDPARMRAEGFTWQSVAKFSEQYGSVETMYEANKRFDEEYSVSSRGKKLGEPKVKPGISPLIFTKFLLDKAVMLDITDMSSHLPALHENVVLVDSEDDDEVEVFAHYQKVVQFLKDIARAGHGMTVLSTMLQFSLSYLDKPYGLEPMLDPLTGEVLCTPQSFDKFAEIGTLRSKEKKLVEIVKKELSENRNCFVYAEYTASPQTCITQRLRDVLMHYVGLKKNEVVILESDTVSASERENWIHEKAAAGMKVCIVNPKCVETGLDFCFKHEGVTYNYPSIIFYQLGYSMFTLYQASRRHYRLNQREECRTFYMAYRGTLQEVVISLIAEKMAATSAIQGKFSAEGLTAMAQGVDTRVRLAQALSNMDNETGKELQNMFDVINDSSNDDSDDSKYTPMLLLHELIGEDAALERTVEELSNIDNSDIFDIIEAVSSESSVSVDPFLEGSIFNPCDARKKEIPEGAVLFASLSETETTTLSEILVAEPEKKEEAVEEVSILSLYDFIVAGSEPAVTCTSKVKKSKKNPVLDGQMMLF